ncbi:hypothetical protein CS022_11020 [Veronia nyctiphanis]|uniref:DUF4377 domain-containing protein n=1 Tax=Veronia nyctiphanis TaxID=1278244 RepID=A0A4Q0YSY8_9GAMM|nr:DUF4377 domain-containing protein [Veronia nyctiphanis]RXJ73254.1 hypothetical protein CS022_11020 [Veronia nyctiphanis]
MFKKALVLHVSILLAACSNPQLPNIDVPLFKPRISPDADLLVVDIAPKKEFCVGLIPGKCLVVDGELFYDQIQGFRFQEGYHYKVKMAVEKAFSGSGVQANASPYKYTLVEVMEKSVQPF